jgi:lactaldehyde dehydrogenase/glycolaldehyde dehydrogenase
VERGRFLRALADEIEAMREEIGAALALESGKSQADASAEALYAAEVTHYHAEWARRIEGEVIPSDSPDENLLLLREPMGVVACLIPFNYPIYTLMRKIAPALMAGNAVVVRPSNHTPTSAMVLARAIEKVQSSLGQEMGVPNGLISVMCMSHDTAQRMCTHPSVAMITLTGSVKAGQQVLEYCKANMAKPSLELGGKTPAIVSDDADLEAAASALVASKTTNCGQLCTAIERVYVHENVHSRFLSMLKERMQARSFGNRALDANHMGPLISRAAQKHAHAMVQNALAQGAVLETGGFIPDGEHEAGYYYPPTLLSNCRQEMDVVQQETFAPILCVMSYRDFEEALALANDHQFGLASVFYTHRYNDVMRAANGIEAGELYINRTPADPYQGYHAGWKRSGLGGDDGKHGLLEFTQTRLVVMKY